MHHKQKRYRYSSIYAVMTKFPPWSGTLNNSYIPIISQSWGICQNLRSNQVYFNSKHTPGTCVIRVIISARTSGTPAARTCRPFIGAQWPGGDDDLRRPFPQSTVPERCIKQSKPLNSEGATRSRGQLRNRLNTQLLDPRFNSNSRGCGIEEGTGVVRISNSAINAHVLQLIKTVNRCIFQPKISAMEK